MPPCAQAVTTDHDRAIIDELTLAAFRDFLLKPIRGPAGVDLFLGHCIAPDRIKFFAIGNRQQGIRRKSAQLHTRKTTHARLVQRPEQVIPEVPRKVRDVRVFQASGNFDIDRRQQARDLCRKPVGSATLKQRSGPHRLQSQ